jgi:hypothetical protein
VLISACGSLIIATSTRLGRVIDRTRQVSEHFGELARVPGSDLIDCPTIGPFRLNFCG